MKNLLVIFLTTVLGSAYSYGQYAVDDGLVTQHLSVNLDKEELASYLEGFASGLNKAKNGEFQSVEDVIAYYDVDLQTFPSLEKLIELIGNSEEGIKLSEEFVKRMLDIFNKTSGEYTDIAEVRNDFVKVATEMSLSGEEAESLALIDISLQTTIEAFGIGETAGISDSNWEPGYSTSGLTMKWDRSPSSIGALSYDYYKLPKWLRCGLGTLGSAILGGFTGVTVGIKFGHVGAAVGGVLGVMAGTFVGVARYCD